MPSPFPGMDPYLEEPGLWPDVHHRLITQISDVLTEQLVPRYYCRIEERVYVDEEDEGHTRVPDLRIENLPGASGPHPPASGVAVAEPVISTFLFPDEIREAHVNVVSANDRQIVAVLEVLSPTNKVPGSVGHASFQQKRQEVLRSSSHWVEIDLLRRGLRMRFKKNLPPCHYAAHVSRMQDRPSVRTWPILLSQRLPVIAVPLKEESEETPLDLQAVFNTVYKRAGYEFQLDYRTDPVPPLTGADSEWADQWLKTKGLR